MEQFFDDRTAPARMRNCFLGQFLDAFAAKLVNAGYSRATIRRKLQVVVRFAHWLQAHGVAVREIALEHTRQHLKQRSQRSHLGVQRTLEQFVEMLVEQGIAEVVKAEGSRSEIEEIIETYANYLRTERRLFDTTIRDYSEYGRRCLKNKFADSELSYPLLSAADVISFVQNQASVLGRKRAKLMTSALRSFLQFLKYQGHINSDLKAAVPTVPIWTMAEIPRALPADQVELVLSKCNRKTTTGRRDYAILMLLARLGLRAGEVVSMRLDDINWDTGVVSIRSKGRASKLPLPPDVGEAIAFYLRDRKPQTNTRALFLRARAPVTGLEKQTAVGCLVKRALARAGVDSPRKGAHQFRHSLATRMLKQGATLAQIGELLRHQHTQTTAIYAKVDLDSLKLLAMAWPGGAQ